jgi:hypothetical protein
VEVVHGEPCSDAVMDQHACSKGRDRGDRGAVLMVSAAPLAVLPIALLVRHWVSPMRDPASTARWHVTPSLLATRDALELSLGGAWF